MHHARTLPWRGGGAGAPPRILRDYLGVDGLFPVYSLSDFERRFRVSMAVFLKIYHGIKD